MAAKQTILVVGATGAQGGSVAHHLLVDGTFGVRAFTRHPDSKPAVELKNAGAEVVVGDLGDFQSLEVALEGCYAAFGVTNYWEHFDQEYQLGKNLIDAVSAAKVEQFIFSTLPHASKITGGKLEVPHFDTKGRLEEYTRSLDLPATFVHVAAYFQNFLSHFTLRKQADGTYAFGFPQGDTPLAMVAVEDIGGVATALFKKPEKYKNRVVGIVGDDRPPHEYAQIMTRILGKPVVYNYIPREVFASFDFIGADDLADMFEFNRLYIPNRQADLQESRSLYPEIQTLDTWLDANRDKFQTILQ